MKEGRLFVGPPFGGRDLVLRFIIEYISFKELWSLFCRLSFH